MSSRFENAALEDREPEADWEVLDSRVSMAVQEIRTALEQALAATRDLSEWVERIHTLSAFMQKVESGLVEARHQLQETPRGPRPVAVPVAIPKAEESAPVEPEDAEAGASEEPAAPAVDTQEGKSGTEPGEATPLAKSEQPSGPAEEEPSQEAASESKADGSVHLEIESSGSNIDLMVVERALRETPGVADVDLLDYAGKRARVRVTLREGESHEDTATPERLAGHVQERLANLVWDGGLSVSVAE